MTAERKRRLSGRSRAWCVLVAGMVATLVAAPSFAASDDAWEAFRADVALKCLAAAEATFVNAKATVDPFGSEHYGLAFVTGNARGAEATAIRAICVYDKQTQAAELGSELPAE
jgi:hypothetical protein